MRARIKRDFCSGTTMPPESWLGVTRQLRKSYPHAPVATKRCVGRAVIFGLAMVSVTPAGAAELRCPPRLPGMHPGFEQVGPIPSDHWLLSNMRLFDGPPGEELKRAPADLAPDQTVAHPGGFTSAWSFADSEVPLMVCTYNGSATYYRARPHRLLKSCYLRNDDGLTQAWCE
jgi:hypothetical protein